MTSDNQTKYTGPSIEELGISNGMMLDVVLTRVTSALIEVRNQKVELDGQKISPIAAIERIDGSIKNFNSDNVKLNGDFETGISMATQPFLNKSFTYTTDIIANNLTFSFNYNSIQENLPSNYNLIYIRNTASSINGSTSNSLIQDNDKLSGVLSIPFDRLPANIRTEIRYNTPDGDILLSASLPIISAVKNSGVIVFDIKDLTTNKKSNSSITDWSKSLTAQINNINNVKNQLDSFTLQGFENVPNQKGIFNCIGALSSICDNVIKNVNSLGTVTMPDFGSCVGGTSSSVGTKTGTPQEAIDSLSSVINSQNQEINSLKTQIAEQTKNINNLSGFYSSIVNSQSGGTLSTQEITGGTTEGSPIVITGSCPGGRCS